MKFQNVLLAAFVISIILTGCGIPSVHPLYKSGDLINKKELNGRWKNDTGTAVYRVINLMQLKQNKALRDRLKIDENDDFIAKLEKKGLGKTYMVFNTDTTKREPEAYLAGLLKINKSEYLDLYEYPPFNDVFFYPVHLFVKIELKKNKLIMHEFREEWIKDLLKKRQIRIEHEVSFDNFLLTAPTEELQRFIAKYGNNPNAYRNDTKTYTKLVQKKA